MADITGAYIAGLIISKNKRVAYISSRFETLSYMFLSPMFFASIGLKVVLPKMSGSIILFAAILLVVAILTKIVGCGLGAKMCRFNNAEAMQVGCGMVSRGEVGLIVASIGVREQIIAPEVFSVVVVLVLLTTLIAPPLLRGVFASTASRRTV